MILDIGNAARRRSPLLQQYLLLLVFIGLTIRWLAYGPLKLLDNSTSPLLASEMEAGSARRGQFQIIVAHHKAKASSLKKWLDQIRGVPFIEELGVETTIYSKGRIREVGIFMNETGSHDIFRLRNQGREAGTFLHHIVKNYDDLANYTMFTHEDPVGVVKASGLFDEAHYDALRYNFDNTTAFLNHGLNEPGLGWCECGKCETKGGHPASPYPLMTEVRKMWTKEPCHGKQRSTPYHQFIVSRDRILGRPKWLYAYLLELVTAPPGHWIHRETQPADVRQRLDMASTPEHPLFLYTMERLWSGLFGCDQDPWANGCKMFLDRDGPAELQVLFPYA